MFHHPRVEAPVLRRWHGAKAAGQTRAVVVTDLSHVLGGVSDEVRDVTRSETALH